MPPVGIEPTISAGERPQTARLSLVKEKRNISSKCMISSVKTIVSLIIVFLHFLFLVGIVVSAQFKMILPCQEI